MVFRQVRAARRRNTLCPVSLCLIIALWVRKIRSSCHSGILLFIEYKPYWEYSSSGVNAPPRVRAPSTNLPCSLSVERSLGRAHREMSVARPGRSAVPRETPGYIPRHRGAPRGSLLLPWRGHALPGVTWSIPGKQLGSGWKLP